MRLKPIASLLPYHGHVNPDARAGKTVFYDIYTKAQKQGEPAQHNTGLFFLRGEPGAPFAVTAPGGGFPYVGSVHEGCPTPSTSASGDSTHWLPASRPRSLRSVSAMESHLRPSWKGGLRRCEEPEPTWSITSILALVMVSARMWARAPKDGLQTPCASGRNRSSETVWSRERRSLTLRRPFRKDYQRIVEGARKAGLPES
jgi:hypothetical protein